MSMSPKILVIADDLTGAADTAAGLAKAGLTTLIAFGRGTDTLPDCDALVVDTDSREIPVESVSTYMSAPLESMYASLAESDRIWYYKKIDSTLRGHPGAELAYVMKALQLDRAVVAPAFPAQGRTTVNGKHLLHGVPLEDTEFGVDGVSSELGRVFQDGGVPIRWLSLQDVRGSADSLARRLSSSAPAVIVSDAETDADLDALAAASLEASIRMCCGSAGFMHALSRQGAWKREAKAPELDSPKSGPVLTVAGSRNPVTLAQVDFAVSQGAVVYRPPRGFTSDDALARAGARDEIVALLNSRDHVVVATAGQEYVANPGLSVGRSLAVSLGAVVREVLAVASVRQLVVTGGAVANRVCWTLKAEQLWVQGEVLPGVPYGRLVGGAQHGLRLVTKAGGFGDADALHAVTR
jgi:uncharacterized protein YgbK (DUF1537 family)